MPIRLDTSNLGKVWRKLRYGDLLDLIVIDTRIWGRDEQDLSLTNDTSHHLLGEDQFQWLEAELADTTTQLSDLFFAVINSNEDEIAMNPDEPMPKWGWGEVGGPYIEN